VSRARATLETSAGGVVVRMDAGVAGGDARPLFLIIRDSYDNWGFPKGHVERGERPEAAALREVSEETGIESLTVRTSIDTIDWYFRFRGRLIHKVCHFYLMVTELADTCPQRSEGITACRWESYEEAAQLVSYANARDVLRRAHELITADSPAS
jgi:8-oxo-dGTP pyrophosphatase MutT (NUDIX family)